MNPLVPTALDGALMAVSLVAMSLALVAFVSVIRSASASGSCSLIWAVVVLLVPIVGPALWFVVRRRQRSAALPRTGDDT